MTATRIAIVSLLICPCFWSACDNRDRYQQINTPIPSHTSSGDSLHLTQEQMQDSRHTTSATITDTQWPDFVRFPERNTRLEVLNVEAEIQCNDWDAIVSITGLKYLTVSNAACPDLPPSITVLKSLESFHYVLGPGVVDLPPALFSLTSLKSLHIEGNDLSVIPKDITKLQRLEDINFGISPISSLPDFLGQMPKLRNIYLSLGEGTIEEAKRFHAKFPQIEVSI